jgi:ArsR family transcriptional regulator, arsenate/arsenite/antimonite-responsive transcriptional repressor / arsenate reductase (thioredoxin)
MHPIETLKLLGNDVRWRLLEQLAMSDRKVNELISAIGQSGNLVSYHLAQLRRAGLVRDRRSPADARDIYYSLRIERVHSLLVDVGEAHPGFCGAGVDSGAHFDRPIARVLFVVDANSARSQMAEALLRETGRVLIEVSSAGWNVRALDPLAIEAMREVGIDIAGQCPKRIDQFPGHGFDYVVSVCDTAHERLRACCFRCTQLSSVACRCPDRLDVQRGCPRGRCGRRSGFCGGARPSAGPIRAAGPDLWVGGP